MSYQSRRLTGQERLINQDMQEGLQEATVLQFWQWAFSDLRSNNIRGIFAEWLVSQILHVPQKQRDTWDEWDLTTEEGVKIEIKTSAYVQTWAQNRHSKIIFSGLRGRRYNATTNTYTESATYNADIYIFCVQIEQDSAQWNALDLQQWRFYVTTVETLRTLRVASLSLTTLHRLCKPLQASELRIQAHHMIKEIVITRQSTQADHQP